MSNPYPYAPSPYLHPVVVAFEVLSAALSVAVVDEVKNVVCEAEMELAGRVQLTASAEDISENGLLDVGDGNDTVDKIELEEGYPLPVSMLVNVPGEVADPEGAAVVAVVVEFNHVFVAILGLLLDDTDACIEGLVEAGTIVVVIAVLVAVMVISVINSSDDCVEGFVDPETGSAEAVSEKGADVGVDAKEKVG